MKPTVFFVGQPSEVGHHAAPVVEAFSKADNVADDPTPHPNVRVVPADQIVQIAIQGDLVVFFSEHFDRFRDACQKLKQRNIATLYMIDGILEWRNAWVNRDDEVACPYTMRPALSHKVACIGNSQARVIESWGNEGKTEVIGIPRLDPLIREFHDKSGHTAVTADQQPVHVLVMTAKTPAFTDKQWTAVQQSLHDIHRWSVKHESVNGRPLKWTWRLTKGLEQGLNVDNQLDDLSGPELFDVLAATDIVISTPSTAMVEAMMFDIPVAKLDYHNCPHYVQTGWDIASEKHIDDAIGSMIERDEVRMLFQQNQLYDAVLMKSSATQRFIELITSMLRVAAESKRTGSPLQFPANILPSTDQVSAEFAHQRLFPNVESFRINDLAQLQAQHSHARREIEQLQGEITQLQSELDEAHQIFESIHQHPIAGPVVRIRQRFLDFMASFGKRDRSTNINPGQQVDDAMSNASTSTKSN
ncbi:MAG: hypothetical protein AAFN77_05595 [Planctomycetota bacterium]